jgi:hypothetical protein
MAEGATAVQRNFLISYTQNDEPWAVWIAWQLEYAGYSCLVQKWDSVPGTDWTSFMDEALVTADRTIAVLSPDYLHSAYGAAEWRAAWGKDPGGRQRKLLVVRVDDCDHPGLLASVVRMDLFGVEESVAKQRLLEGVRGALSGRSKPATEPPFPPSCATACHQSHIDRAPLFPGSLQSEIVQGQRGPTGGLTARTVRRRLEELQKLSDVLHESVVIEYQKKIMSRRWPED